MTINENGDRSADYSLLDMDPKTGNFTVCIILNEISDISAPNVDYKTIFSRTLFGLCFIFFLIHDRLLTKNKDRRRLRRIN